ncbi:uncharacterized protein SCHCODRAFT_02663894 [Schizophyllum commune H4-8]|nr:uncharacterized protein SCHCODRAFT_02663894 [Schizophyllum commune H4-8]KAI5896029.1 hypothetical protein SCHCODRAFT_02663894 [Schizophyllum commune H4-8]
MTQSSNLNIAAGMSREEMDMMIRYLSQQRAALGDPDNGQATADGSKPTQSASGGTNEGNGGDLQGRVAVDNPTYDLSKKATSARKKAGGDPSGEGGPLDKRAGHDILMDDLTLSPSHGTPSHGDKHGQTADAAEGVGGGNARPTVVVEPSTPRKKFVPRPVQKKGPVAGNGGVNLPSTPVKSSVATPSSVTPSSKMAQLDLDGHKVIDSSPGTKKGRATVVPTRVKAALPNGYDALLTYEEHVRPPEARVSDPGPYVSGNDSDDDMFPEDPSHTLPNPSSDAVKRDAGSADVTEPQKHSSRGPSMARWINTRGTKSNDDPTPPPDEPWARKNRRRRSPSPVPPSTPSPVKKSPKKKARVSSPEESPEDARVQQLECELAEARKQIKTAQRRRGRGSAATASFIDDEAEESDMDGRRRDDPDLDNFVVGDDVVEYDDSAPALPDDDEAGSSRVVDDENTSDDHVEIVPTPPQDKGKGRAPRTPSPDPVDPAFVAPAMSEDEDGSGQDSEDDNDVDVSWQHKEIRLQNAPRGLHPGSTAVDAGAQVVTKLQLGDGEDAFHWRDFLSPTLQEIGYHIDYEPLPRACGLNIEHNPKGWDYPVFDDVLAQMSDLGAQNLFAVVKFRRVGPYVNPANANVSDFSAVKVSGPSSTPRYRCVVSGSRAPAVALTTGIIRYWRLDTPSNGPRPQRYVIVSPFYGFFEATVCFFCTLFGQYTLNCLSWDNALRIATIPPYERPGGSVQQSAAVRGNVSSNRAPRRSAFELNTNDDVPVYDARKTALPEDISMWPKSLPILEGPLPKNAVATVAYTPTMWIGNQPSYPAYNLQFNIFSPLNAVCTTLPGFYFSLVVPLLPHTMSTIAAFTGGDMFSGLAYDIVREILKWLRRPDLWNLALTSSTMRATVSDFLVNDYNADSVLCRFFDDIHSFQAIQARTCSIIGGSTALSFFTGHHWPTSDLDLYIKNEHALDMARYLERSGYRFVPRNQHDSIERCLPVDWEQGDEEDDSSNEHNDVDMGNIPIPFHVMDDDDNDTDSVHDDVDVEMTDASSILDNNDDDNDDDDSDDDDDISGDEDNPEHAYAGLLTQVFNFCGVRDPDLRIQLIVNEGSLLDCILAYHSTPVMNFLTSSRAVSMYPLETLRGRGLRLQTKADATGAINKYKARGWDIIDGVSTPEQHGFATGVQYIGDDISLTVKFTGSHHHDNDIFQYDSYLLHCDPASQRGERPSARLEWYTRGPPRLDIPRTVPDYGYWLWLRKAMTVPDDEDEEKRVSAYLCRQFDLHRLKATNAELKVESSFGLLPSSKYYLLPDSRLLPDDSTLRITSVLRIRKQLKSEVTV